MCGKNNLRFKTKLQIILVNFVVTKTKKINNF